MTNKNPIKVVIGLGTLAVVGIIALFLGFNSWTTVAVGEVKVGSMFGKVMPEPYTEGFHIVNPLASFERYDVKDQSVSWDDITIPSKDKLRSSMDVTVVYTIDGAMAPVMLSEVGTQAQMLSKHISPKVQSKLREAGKTIENAQDLFTETTQQALQSYMEEGLSTYLGPLGVNVKAVMFSDIRMPDVVNKAVKATKETQELLEREKATLAIVQQQELQKVVAAEARAKSATEDAKAKIIVADAKAYAILKEATAQAEANTLLSDSVSPTLVDYIRANNWNGVMPTTTVGKDNGILLNIAGN